MRNKQQGAALVIVLAFLTGAMIVGVSGMQSSLIDERLAGNYRASAQAQMNAEQAASLAVKKVREYKESAGKNNLDILDLTQDSAVEDVKMLDYADVDADDKRLQGKKYGDCAKEGEDKDRCFYFPLAIANSNHWVAFGAVVGNSGKNEKVISQSVALVSFTSATSSADEIADKFNDYGILSDEEAEVEAEEKNIPFYGIIRSNDNDEEDEEEDEEESEEDEEDDFDVEFKDSEEERENEEIEESGFSTEYVKVPKFNFKNYFNRLEKSRFGGYSEKNSNCSVRYAIDVERFCEKNLVVAEAYIYRSVVYFDKDVTVESSLTVIDSTIFIDGDLTVKGAAHLSATGGVSNIIVTGDVVFDAEGGDEKGEDDGENNNPIGLDLSNTVIVAGGKLEFDAMSSQGLRNVLIMSDDEMDIYFDDIDKIYKGWFYSGDELDMEIENSPNMTFCGSLMARKNVGLETDPYIKRFDSSGRNGCPKFSGFDGPLHNGSDGGKPTVDAWQ
ncbi:hypothetical protein GCM10022228_15680 [Halomonas cibimaris]|uniref:Type 4 fimbrial biogenesis protein PilX N-terminal domain-containing protein n=1 Tax=Halomonas cibimaris TaxID=657012 RepID=A0ABP7LVR5_9GAMM